MKISCKKAKRLKGGPKEAIYICHSSAREGKPCLFNFWCACKGWYELREGALTCKYAKEEENV